MSAGNGNMDAQFPYLRFGAYLRERFGEKVHKVSIDAGFSCPNRSGGAYDGCAWCDNSSFNPNRRNIGRTVREQTELGVKLLREKIGVNKFLAYFQAYTNTDDTVDRLERLYHEALAVEGVVGLAIGTRPDCIDEEKISMLSALSRECYVQLEYGLQSGNNQTLQHMGRGHDVEAFRRAMSMSVNRGFDLCGHMIVGLPGEDCGDYVNTLQVMLDCGITGVKIHNLHIVRGSRLAAEYLVRPFALLGADEYIQIIVDLLERIPPRVNIQRLWGAAGSKKLHIAPDWCLDHNLLMAKLRAEFTRRGTRQGSALE